MNYKTLFRSLKNEVWKVIPDTNEMYYASNFSRIRSVDRFVINRFGFKKYVRGKLLRKQLAGADGNKYHMVSLCIHNKKKRTYVHSLVFYAFNGFYPRIGSKMVIDHKDNNSLNNNIENLQLITQRENSYKDRTGCSSKYPGVCYRKERNAWQSSISINREPPFKLLYCKDEDLCGKSYILAIKNIEKYNGNKDEFRKLIKSLL